jgi:hypothetical protein
LALSLFDLLFLCIVLGSFITLLTIIAAALGGKRYRALVLLRAWGTFIALYLVSVSAVRSTLPVRVLAIGDPQCSDDWCITVANVSRNVSAFGTEYVVDLQLTSRARRVAQRENGLIVYLTDAHGNRYNPLPDPSALPLDVLLQAGESVTAKRKFEVPDNAGRLDLVVTHEGFGIGWLIIGRSPFMRTVVRID